MRRQFVLFVFCVVATLSAVMSSTSAAQVVSGLDAGRAPRVLYTASGMDTPTLVDIASVPLLQRRITLNLQAADRRDALADIAKAAGLQLLYSDDVLPAGGRVHLVADQISVAAALTEVLLGTGVDIVLSASGRAALVKRTVPAMKLQGLVTGRVTERLSAAPVPGARVEVVGAKLSATTDADGRYRLGGVAEGKARIRVARLGFKPVEDSVTVTSNSTASLDFLMTRLQTVLEEMVATATGERERLEVGNSIATIKADSIVANNLIRNVSDLLTARTAGVVVATANGLVGATSLVRVRGTASVSLSNDPVIILDGIRLSPASYAGAGTSIGNAGNQGVVGMGPTRLDDIDPSTIESIDVLRGPSAASLYGTDAAAGVIVIKTKQAHVGSWRSNVTADGSTSRVPKRFPLQYAAYGHLPNGTPIATCYVYRLEQPNVVDHTCVQDSVVAYDTFGDSRLSLIGTGTGQNVYGSISGGTEQVREFLSLRVNHAVGVTQLNAAERSRIARMWGEPAPSWVLHPNSDDNVTGSTRTNLHLSSGLDVALSGSGIYRSTYVAPPQGVFAGFATPFGNALARNLYDTLVYLPAENQRAKSAFAAKRGYGSAAATYTAFRWLLLRGTLGGDYTSRGGEALLRAADCTALLNPNGCSSFRFADETQTFVTTADFGAQATWQARNWLQLRTSTGEQLSRTRFYELGIRNSSSNLAFGTDFLTPTPVPTSTGTQIFITTESRDESAVAGMYVEETAAVHDRLFVTAAFRRDVASAFGSTVNAKAPVYPKYSFSWLLSNESFFPKTSLVQSLRLRSAYGHSGQEARQTAVLNTYDLTTSVVDGVLKPAVALSNPGNPTLKPERTAEWEGGFDLSLFDNERLSLEATMYRKVSNDAISRIAPPMSLGGNPGFPLISRLETINLGKVENRGLELRTTAHVIERPTVSWDITANATHNTNKLITSTITSLPGGFTLTGDYPGYPLQSFFGHLVTGYADFNHDGVLQPNEVQVSTPLVWLGSVNPDFEATYATNVRLWGGALQVNANFDQVNGRTSVGTSREGSTDPITGRQAYVPGSLAQQAAWYQANVNLNGTAAYARRSNSIRFGELSLTGVLPKRVVAALRARNGTATIAGRNLGLWTNSPDYDPAMFGNVVRLEAGSTSPNALPITRDFTFRVSLGY